LFRTEVVQDSCPGKMRSMAAVFPRAWGSRTNRAKAGEKDPV
jgi:hypothetical protein